MRDPIGRSRTPVGDVCWQLGVNDGTFYAWKKKYAYLGLSELRQLRQLEEESCRLKRLVVDLPLEWIIGRNSNQGRSKLGPIAEACNSTSFGRADRWRTPSLNRLTDDSEMSV